MTNQLASLDGSVGLDPDGPVDREAAGPEGAALGQLEPEALEPRGRLGVGVAAVERVARCRDRFMLRNQNIGQCSAVRRRLGCVISLARAHTT